MKKHFVTFFSPGTFISEESAIPIEAWDVAKAVKMSKSITERYNATPYAFQFTTRSRTDKDLDSKESARSPLYWLSHCKIETLQEVEARNDPKDEILLANMRNNNWPRVVTTTKGWKFTMPFGKDDILLEPEPTKRTKK